MQMDRMRDALRNLQTAELAEPSAPGRDVLVPMNKVFDTLSRFTEDVLRNPHVEANLPKALLLRAVNMR